MTENRAIIDYNTVKENLEMERIQHDIEIKALEEKLRVAAKVLEMVEDNRKMPHVHAEYQTRLNCLAERAREALEVITKEECNHQWEYLAQSIYKQCSQCEKKELK